MEQPSKPKNKDKFMTMTTKNNENRTGIYVQESAGVTTAGDGLDPRGDKSPVAQHYDNTFIRTHSEDVRNRSTSRLSSIVREGNESDTNDDEPDGNLEFRQERNNQMTDEFLKLGFIRPEIRAMRIALKRERRRRFRINKLLRNWDQTNLDSEQWLQFKANQIAKIRVRTPKYPKQDRYSPGSSGNFSRESNVPKNINRVVEMIFVSPAILAGAIDQDYPFAANRIIAAKRIEQRERLKGKQFEEARRRMGLSGQHIIRRYSSDSPENQDCPDSLNTQIFKAIQAKYPIDVTIVNKSHPFGEIPIEMRFLILDALETTVQDERATGAHWIKISPGRYEQKLLHVNCKNIDSVRFLESKVSLYNRLWREADLLVTTEMVNYKRSRYIVDLPNFDLTSDEFLRIIKKQNSFPTEHWPFYHKTRENNRFKAIFGVDPESARRLEEANGSVYFFFGTIKFICSKKLNIKN